MKNIIIKIKSILLWSIIFFTSRCFNILYKLDENKVLFMSDVRKVMGGNLKFVYDYLKINTDFKLVFELKADRRVKRGFKGFIKLMKNLATSKYVLLDDYSRTINLIRVRKNQEIIQLWHGPGAFKKFGYSRPRHEKYKNLLVAGHKNYTKSIVTAEDIRWCFAEGFGMDINQINATGYPRTDIFFDYEYKNKIRDEIFEEFPNLKNKKIITFAPTYRGESTRVANYDLSKLNLDKLYELFKDDYVFIIKWHPAVYNNIKLGIVENYDIKKYNGFILDFSDKRDINDLLFITDILITDYSSLIFDYSLLDKPIIFYTYDLDKYENDRGLYFDFNEYVYGQVARNIDELCVDIKKEDMSYELRKKFFEKFMSACDGNSTYKTCEWIFGKKNLKKQTKVSTSVLSVKEDESKKIFKELIKAKTDYFHIDVMDGKFVEANTERKMWEFACKLKNQKLDIHLMTQDPEAYIDKYITINPDIITFHLEAVKDKNKLFHLIEKIRINKIKVGISIKPKTSVNEILELLPYIDLVLVMSVEPGKEGQSFIPDSTNKIKKIKEYIMKNKLDINIQVDGGINKDTSKLVKEAGANNLVAGIAIISSNDFYKTITNLKS